MRALLLVLILTVGACAKQSVTLPMAWARADGQPVNSALLDIDSIDCKDEMQKPDGAVRSNTDKATDNHALVDDFVTCMRVHGYVQIKS
jgi:hypothetical protein